MTFQGKWMTNNKTERKQQILANIIRIYVSTAVPVSSKSVTKDMDNSISSATVRNVMSELEETGYITQPHTSAGRVPTDLGYRYYVDFINSQVQLEKKKIERLTRKYFERIKSIKDVIETTSSLISCELHHASVVMWPNIGNFHLKHLELVKVRAETVLAVLVTMTNDVKNYMIKLNRELANAELERVANYINDNFEEEKVDNIADYLKHTIKSDRKDEVTGIAEIALTIIDNVLDEDIENDIYWEGLDHFAGEPEFKGSDITSCVLKAFTDRKELINLLRKELPFRGIRTYIGSENECKMFRRCSIITSGYDLHGKTIGRIGVIGPTRMDYDNVIRTVRYLSDFFEKKLADLNR